MHILTFLAITSLTLSVGIEGSFSSIEFEKDKSSQDSKVKTHKFLVVKDEPKHSKPKSYSNFDESKHEYKSFRHQSKDTSKKSQKKSSRKSDPFVDNSRSKKQPIFEEDKPLEEFSNTSFKVKKNQRIHREDKSQNFYPSIKALHSKAKKSRRNNEERVFFDKEREKSPQFKTNEKKRSNSKMNVGFDNYSNPFFSALRERDYEGSFTNDDYEEQPDEEYNFGTANLDPNRTFDFHGDFKIPNNVPTKFNENPRDVSTPRQNQSRTPSKTSPDDSVTMMPFKPSSTSEVKKRKKLKLLEQDEFFENEMPTSSTSGIKSIQRKGKDKESLPSNQKIELLEDIDQTTSLISQPLSSIQGSNKVINVMESHDTIDAPKTSREKTEPSQGLISQNEEKNMQTISTNMDLNTLYTPPKTIPEIKQELQKLKDQYEPKIKKTDEYIQGKIEMLSNYLKNTYPKLIPEQYFLIQYVFVSIHQNWNEDYQTLVLERDTVIKNLVLEHNSIPSKGDEQQKKQKAQVKDQLEAINSIYEVALSKKTETLERIRNDFTKLLTSIIPSNKLSNQLATKIQSKQDIEPYLTRISVAYNGWEKKCSEYAGKVKFCSAALEKLASTSIEEEK